MQIMTMAMTDSLLTISFLGQFHKYTNSFYKEFHHSDDTQTVENQKETRSQCDTYRH